MKTQALKLVLLTFVITLISSCSTEDDGIFFEKINEHKVEYSKMELEILDLINNYRMTKGLPLLEKMNIISSVAQSHTKYMISKGQVSHDNFPQRNENLVVNADAKKVGETVAYGYGTAKGVVHGWLNSDAHRAVLENPNYTHFGISTEQNEIGKNYFTQMFIQQ